MVQSYDQLQSFLFSLPIVFLHFFLYMKVIKSAETLASELQNEKNKQHSVGFVPTMGALHNGHISLVENCKNDNDITVVSIFVNPKQFGEAKDLDTYPKPIEKDMELLLNAKVDYLFLPDYDDMYPDDMIFDPIPLGDIETKLEGDSRPGHFQGVALVIKRFFDIIHPNRAYFGQKDFQQTVVIQFLIRHFNLSTELIICPIIRESNGLAMSSRNVRMNDEDRKNSGFLYQALRKLKEATHHVSLKDALERCRKFLTQQDGVHLEYLAAVNGYTMQEVSNLNDAPYIAVVTVIQFGGIRMVDNIIIKKDNE